MNYISKNANSIQVTDELAKKAIKHLEVVEATLDIRGVDHEDLEPIAEYSRYVLIRGSYI